MDTSELFSREALAGYDRALLGNAVVAVIGAGAAANNFVQTTALAGVGEHRIVDFDVVEPSNLTRSPFFRRACMEGGAPRHKARELALGALAASYADSPVVRYATARIEALGYGAFLGAHVIVSAVDSYPVRAYLADAARFLRIPLVDMGFSGFDGQVAVFSNESADDACWRCLMPQVTHGGFSCTAYARAVTDSGRVPATQTVAAVVGSLAAEAAIAAVHGEFPLGSRVLTLNLRSGRSRVLEIAPNPSCPGVHRCAGPLIPLAATSDEPLLAAIKAGKAFAREPVVHLRSPIVIEAPCAACGARVVIHRPSWMIHTPPRCSRCGPPVESAAPATAVVLGTIDEGHPLARMKAAKLGLRPGDVFEMEDAASGALGAVRLAGTVDNLFVTKRRERHEGARAPMDQCEAGDIGPKEQ